MLSALSFVTALPTQSTPGTNAYPGLFCHVEPFFVSGSFRTLFFASTTTKSSRASFSGIVAFILKANLNMTVSLKQMPYNSCSTSHGMPLGFDKHEEKIHRDFCCVFPCLISLVVPTW